jgi:hypothetical protein
MFSPHEGASAVIMRLFGGRSKEKRPVHQSGGPGASDPVSFNRQKVGNWGIHSQIGSGCKRRPSAAVQQGNQEAQRHVIRRLGQRPA